MEGFVLFFSSISTLLPYLNYYLSIDWRKKHTLCPDKYFLKVTGPRKEVSALKTRASKQLPIEDEKPRSIWQLYIQRTGDAKNLQNKYNMKEQVEKN